jgi:hypothetical protein
MMHTKGLGSGRRWVSAIMALFVALAIMGLVVGCGGKKSKVQETQEKYAPNVDKMEQMRAGKMAQPSPANAAKGAAGGQ